MDIIKTGIGIHRTIKNVGRLREIVLVFAKNGFNEFITLGVTSRIPNFVLPKTTKGIKEELEEKEDLDWSAIVGNRVRIVFEELGPSFVKLGQLLSSREDIFDASFIDEMKKLRDQVKPVPFEESKAIVEASLGSPISEVFSEFESKPIGTASIGVVYKAKLLSGEKVVVKVRRPNIETIIKTDFEIVSFLVEQIERVSEEIKFIGLSRLVNDFGATMQKELNFHVEALSCSRYRDFISNHDNDDLIHIPKIYEDYTREDILVMELMEGIPFSDADRIKEVKGDLEVKLNLGLNIFLNNFLKDGFFHADLHGGNFFYQPNGQLGIIDFGLMGTLSPKGRKNFIAIIYSLISFNYENLVYEFLEVAEYEKIPNLRALIGDVRDCLSPYVGLTVQQVDFSIVLKSVFDALKKHQIYLPREWFIVFRSLMTLDGVGRSLDMDFDIYKMMEGDINKIIQDSFSKDELLEEGLWAAKDFLSSARIFPRNLKWFIREWSKNGYAFEHRILGLDKNLNKVNSSLLFMGFSFIAGVFVSVGAYMLSPESIDSIYKVPLLSWIFWFFGAVFFSYGFRQTRKSR